MREFAWKRKLDNARIEATMTAWTPPNTKAVTPAELSDDILRPLLSQHFYQLSADSRDDGAFEVIDSDLLDW